MKQKIVVINKIRYNLMNYDNLAPFDCEIHFIGTHKYSESVPDKWKDRCSTFWSLDELTFEALDLFINQLVPVERLICFAEEDLYLAAVLRERHNIPGPKPTDIAPFRDKFLMKSLVAAQSIRVPRFVRLYNLGENCREIYAAAVEMLGMPFVIKPRLGMANQGVFFIQEIEDLSKIMNDKIFAKAIYMAEQYISGPMFHVDTLIWGGHIQDISISEYNVPPVEARKGPTGSFIIDALSNDFQRLHDLNARVLAALKAPDGCTHAEYFKGEDGEFYFCEVGARIGGTQIIPVIEKVKGYSFARRWFSLESGIPYSSDEATTTEPFCGFIDFPIPAYSTITDLILAPPLAGVELIEQRVCIGQKTGAPVLEQNRAISFLVSDVSPQAVAQKINELIALRPVRSEPL
ncbi:hypothetical protein VZ95_20395 [Elstera litoralis]|uniref:ATP-grasp domain-containing protein n=1 Tax=Elstera litoralis TaxID=552518 RepID=A0A0F3IJM5_9PROT|nr:ATP-grasp domain-containing protein [Elstera litoralis]KJV06975.1 hypothetical protein VZ95_20395 [Elstera litoralis]